MLDRAFPDLQAFIVLRVRYTDDVFQAVLDDGIEQLASPIHNGQPVWVSCDFERDTLRAGLLGSGFGPARPSVVASLRECSHR
jgi:O-methyltransferase involved in polyketide biosynthesis